jgi:hypothetical protein
MSQEKSPDRTFDIRTLDFQLQRGIITKKEYDQYLKSLPDDEGNYDEVVIHEEPSESDLDLPDEETT